jgi:tellurite resistance protein
MDVAVKDRDRVAEDFVVDPAQATFPTCALHSFADQRQVEEELLSVAPSPDR